MLHIVEQVPCGVAMERDPPLVEDPEHGLEQKPLLGVVGQVLRGKEVVDASQAVLSVELPRCIAKQLRLRVVAALHEEVVLALL